MTGSIRPGAEPINGIDLPHAWIPNDKPIPTTNLEFRSIMPLRNPTGSDRAQLVSTIAYRFHI